jgi:putative ABC transport system ATP-binding protein
MLVDLEGVSFSHGSQAVLRRFDLAINKGEHSLLLGPSGSGKSTVINLVCGFLSPQQGAVRISGECISVASETQRDAIRRRFIAVIFQSLRLVSALDVMANLMLAARLAGRSATADEAYEMLARLGIGSKAKALPRSLSQGEAQRAAIARALISKPRLLIADEPTSALDDYNAMAVTDLLLEVADREGLTLLVATHDVRLRRRLGRTIELAAPMENTR